jgi:photosystem II stability/assembly factor-like uncharacterized protein
MDSERGVSSEASLYYTNGFNRNLASPARPTKALAPWWDDLTLEHGGGISYETLGTEPNRTFIIQWKDIRAEFKDVNAARLNFQIQLHETTNIIEFHYGPMVYGTFAGPLVGASIGFKDHVGGDFHFYDLMAGDTGRASDLMADISPLADWPGPDSCYVIQTSPSQNIAWQIQNSGSANNLIGVDALSEQIAWIGGLNGTVLQTDDGGNTWNEVWGLSDTLHIYNIEGLDADNALVSAWSEDSSTTYIFRTNDGGLSWLSVYEQAYGFIDDITMFNQTEGVAIGDPVGGFWTILKTTDGGHTWLPIPEARAALENEYGLRNGVTWVSEFTGWVGTTGPRAYRIEDSGQSWTQVEILFLPNVRALAFTSTGTGMAVAWTGELAKTMDGGDNWEEIQSPLNGNTSYVFSQADVFWLMIDNSIFISTDNGLNWELESSTNTILNHIDLITTDHGTFGLSVGENGNILHYLNYDIVTEIGNEISIPHQFVLFQNYPNPFNPETTIKYTLPKTDKVLLKIYNSLGQEVKTLVNEIQPSGQKSFVWDGKDNSGSKVSSGIYVYQLKAGRESKSKKMLFLR